MNTDIASSVAVETPPPAETSNAATAEETEFGYQPEEKRAEHKPGTKYDPVEDDEEVSSADDDDSAAKSEGGEEAPPKAEEKPPLSRPDWAEYGLTEEQARTLEAAGGLDTFCDVYDRRAMAAGQKALEAEGKPPEAPRGEAQSSSSSESKSARAEQSAAAAPPVGPLKLRVSKDDYNEEVYGDLSDIVTNVNAHHSRVEQLEKSMQAVLQTFARNEQAAFETRMDAYFDSLGEDYAEILGKGSVSDLPRDSKHFAKRVEIAKTMRAFAIGYEADGQGVPDEQTLRERATRIVLGDHTQQLARKKVTAQVRDARGQFVARPTHRNGKALSPDEAAVQFAEGFFKKRGIT